MTEKLYKKFLKKYVGDYDSISIYGAHERIYLTLRDASFVFKNDLITLDEFNNLCNDYFKDFYELKHEKEFGQRGKGVYVILNPEQNLKYKEYDNHLIKLCQFYPPLDLEIWTGNRGRVDLIDSQKEKYFCFVDALFKKFKGNALKA